MSATVCLLTESPEPSGMGEHMLALAAALRERYHVSLICPLTDTGMALLARAAALGLETCAIAAKPPDAGDERLLRWLEAHRPDVLHVHAGIGWEGHAGCRAGRAAGVPVVLRTEHLPDLITEPDQRVEFDRTAGLVDGIICVSDAVRDSFRAAGVPAATLRVVRNGIAPEPVPAGRAVIRARLGVGDGERLVLTVGRMTEQKGYRYLAEALPVVLESVPDASFIWIGDGPLMGELQERVARLGVAGRVRFAGRRGDIHELLAAADLFVLPSLFEGLPLVVLEAMAAGLPVVGTRVCGTAEAVLDGVTGRLVGPENSAALALAIAEALSQPEQAARWGAAGRRRVAADFTAARMASETAAIYEELLAAGDVRSRIAARTESASRRGSRSIDLHPRSVARPLVAGE